MFTLHLSVPLRGTSDVRRLGCDIEDAARGFAERHPDEVELEGRPEEDCDLRWPDAKRWSDVLAFDLQLDEDRADELVSDLPSVVRDHCHLVLDQADGEPEDEIAFAKRHSLTTEA